MRKLILFTVTDIGDMLKKGNVWYLRHYEAYFDKIYALYILGARQKPITKGNTTLVAVGTGNRVRDLFFAPYRIYKFAKKTGPADYLTADPLFLWWTSILIKFLLKAKVYFLPVCMPDELFKNTNKTLLRIPIWVKKIFLKLSFMAANRVITTKNATIYVKWLKSIRYARNKLQVVDMIVDEMPTMEFYESFGKETANMATKERMILYVGRLNREKMVDDIIKMFACIQKNCLDARLRIIGDGLERKSLESMAMALGVKDKVEFLGYKPNGELAQYYKSSDVFVSPLTGSSLREAALCKLPIVAYNIDWVRGFLVHEKNALLVERGDVEGMSRQVVRALQDKELSKNIAETLYGYALEKWDRDKIKIGLEQTFGDG
jgi:glycosyltransferase involved in cell wall biosynthesis